MKQTLHLDATDHDRDYYRYLPFTVGDHWPSVAVDMSYDRSRAIIDLGLMGPEGFRGWSGGARQSVQVAEAWATPGYLPGPLGGDWSVMLGLYQLPPSGVGVHVTIGPGPSRPPPARPWPPVPGEVPTLPRLPARPGYRWAAGDFHSHSEHSDGALSLAQLGALARARGLDFLAVTDHNTVSHFPHLEPLSIRYGVTLLPGQEVTTPEGHANCIGDVRWADFRTAPDDWMTEAEADSGLASLNHPVLGSLSWRKPFSHRPVLMELWHSSWDRTGQAPFRFWSSLDCATPLGGSDFHRLGEVDATGADLLPGAPTSWVEVPADDPGSPLSSARITEGVRAGNVAISASPTGPAVIRRGDELVVVGGDGTTVVVLEEPSQPCSSGRRWPVRSYLSILRSGPGIALLKAKDIVLALCP